MVVVFAALQAFRSGQVHENKLSFGRAATCDDDDGGGGDDDDEA